MTVFRTALVIVRALAMALWVGALAGFAFMAAPIAFQSMGPTPPFATMIAAILKMLYVWGGICASVALLATIALGERGRFRLIFSAILLVMMSLNLYERSGVIPQMEHTALQTPAYDALHKISSEVYGIVLLLGFTAIALLSVRNEGDGNSRRLRNDRFGPD